MQEQFDIPLASLTTMHVGGPARRLVVAETIDEIVDAVRETDDAGEPLLVLSGGSNLLIADEGFPGTVVKIANQGLEIEHDSDCGGVTVRVGAGVVWDDFVREACERDWSGIEALSGIPGLAGATPVQNVGAYGQEVAQTITGVRPKVTQVSESVAQWGIVRGDRTGVKATLRGEAAWEFVDKVVQLVFPKIKEWKGVEGE